MQVRRVMRMEAKVGTRVPYSTIHAAILLPSVESSMHWEGNSRQRKGQAIARQNRRE